MRCNEFLLSAFLYFFVFQKQCLTQNDPFCCSENTKSCDSSQKYNSQENKENIALYKYATSSALWNRNDGKDSGPPCVAVNGNTSSTFEPMKSSSPNCIYSDGSSIGDWWKVDLGDNYTITSVTIYQTKSYYNGLKYVNISVDEQLCYKLNGDYIPTPSVNISCTPALKGRHITIAKYNNSGDQIYLTFCEVQVWVCMAGFYGSDCRKTCGYCEGGNQTCYRYTGECPSECTPGFYGKNCTLNCPENCLNTKCSQEGGSCGGACKPKFAGDKCDECTPGVYGKNCTLNCPDNCLHTNCSQEDGSCGGLCKIIFSGDKCNECMPGYYGKNCSLNCSENCVNTSCSQEDGSCGGRCKDPFTGDKCDECKFGLYGKNCSLNCSENCINTKCNQVDGSCEGGCKAGFAGDQCNDCKSGLYGDSCTQNCGQCKSVTCNRSNGTCEDDCKIGFSGTMCNNTQITGNEDSVGIEGGAVAGIVVGLLATISAVTIILIILMRRRRLNKQNETQKKHEINTGTIGTATVSGKTPNLSTDSPTEFVKPKATVKPRNISESAENRNEGALIHTTTATGQTSDLEKNTTHLYESVKSPSSTPEVSDTGSNLPQSTQPTTLAPKPLSAKRTNENEFLTVIHSESESNGQLYQNVETVNNRPVVPRKPTVLRKSCDLADELDIYADDKNIIYNNEDIYATYTPANTVSQMDTLQKSLLSSLSSGKLAKQFEELPKKSKHPCAEGVKPENVRKNRFKALCPYDHTRVKLIRPLGDKQNDYINASYIKGFQREKAYIAAQGPRAHTVDDMWLMIWQENICQIVMLTNIKEEGKDKCEEYWPNSGSTHMYGHVSVTGVNTESRADFIIRRFLINFKDKPFQRQIDQYHFVTWPDHGVPTAFSLVSFWRYIKARAVPNVPLLVHCSAGVGRTGTFIALDIAMEMAALRRDINVHRIVSELREDRSIMVQAEAQYKFLYEVILEAYTSRTSRLTFEQFDATFTDTINFHESNQLIDKEFKMFQQMEEFVPKPKHEVATVRENLIKNRNPKVLPDDSYLAYLGVPVKGRNTYINAVFLSSFRYQKGIIITQLPLPDTLVDIWRLVDDKDISTIVSIGSKEEEETVTNYCQYWPKAVREVITTGPYTITLSTSTVLDKHLTSFHLILKKEKTTRDIRLLHYWNWTGEVPEDTSDLIHLVETLNASYSEEDMNPILVQCLDGATKSGLFCIVWDVLSRARCDQELDVYLSARHIQRVRSQAVTSQVQYRYCYRVAQDFHRHLGVYQNT